MKILAVVCVLVATLRLSNAQVTSGSSCSAVLDAGVYNIITSSSSASNYQQIQTALCTSYSGYTYNAYKLSRATFDSSGGVDAGSGSSSYCNSKAFRFDVAARASLFGFGGGGSGSSATSSSECASNSQSTYNSYQLLTQSAFNEAMTSINAYQASSCGSSNILTTGSSTVQYLSKIIDPAVYSAYIACLKLYASGIQYTVTTGFDSTSMAVDLLYVPALNNVPAQLYGLTTSSSTSVSCKLSGPGITVAQSTSFLAKLVPNTAYTIFCQLLPGTPSDGRFSDIYISVSPGGTYHGILFHGVPKNQINVLKAQVKTLSTQLKALQAENVLLQSTVVQQTTEIASLQTDGASLQSTTASQTTKIATLQQDVASLQNAVTDLTAQVTSLQSTVTTQSGQIALLISQGSAHALKIDTFNGYFSSFLFNQGERMNVFFNYIHVGPRRANPTGTDSSWVISVENVGPVPYLSLRDYTSWPVDSNIAFPPSKTRRNCAPCGNCGTGTCGY